MAPFRNFFPKRPAVNIVPASDDPPTLQNAAGNGPDGPQRSSLTFRRSVDEKPNEYKMSVVNDNGVYLPPSPIEKKSFWRKSSSQNNTRNLVDENEPFSISRESFDSYRRSFDISARSPVSQCDTGASRTSLDSRFSRLTTPRSTVSGHTFDLPPKAPYEIREQQQEHEHENEPEQEQFVDIGLNEDTKPKKKGFFARFGDNVMTATATSTTGSTTSTTAGTGGVESAENSRPGSSHLSLGFHLPGRKREQGGGGAAAAGGFQVAELTSMKMPVTADAK
ncbi:hypothetical protein ACJ73_02323 [Blastomyces percursus]|uniref:Uncharacterized protein n=1 Tax=Blastomyces percursus TaxID=1658174 RepID=A0A1J9QCP5_9EURO|nr:hypothetical protein ACJ73_02323 [Blastomyces percursus]